MAAKYRSLKNQRYRPINRRIKLLKAIFKKYDKLPLSWRIDVLHMERPCFDAMHQKLRDALHPSPQKIEVPVTVVTSKHSRSARRSLLKDFREYALERGVSGKLLDSWIKFRKNDVIHHTTLKQRVERYALMKEKERAASPDLVSALLQGKPKKLEIRRYGRIVHATLTPVASLAQALGDPAAAARWPPTSVRPGQGPSGIFDHPESMGPYTAQRRRHNHRGYCFVGVTDKCDPCSQPGEYPD